MYEIIRKARDPGPLSLTQGEDCFKLPKVYDEVEIPFHLKTLEEREQKMKKQLEELHNDIQTKADIRFYLERLIHKEAPKHCKYALAYLMSCIWKDGKLYQASRNYRWLKDISEYFWFSTEEQREVLHYLLDHPIVQSFRGKDGDFFFRVDNFRVRDNWIRGEGSPQSLTEFYAIYGEPEANQPWERYDDPWSGGPKVYTLPNGEEIPYVNVKKRRNK